MKFLFKKGTLLKKGTALKKKAFLEQNFRFLSKKRHFWNKICDFCQKKGTLSKKRHRVKKKALKKDISGHKFKPHLSKFYRKLYDNKKKDFRSKFVSLCTKDCLFYWLFLLSVFFVDFLINVDALFSTFWPNYLLN